MPKTIHDRSPIVIAFTVLLALLLLWPAWTATQNALSDLYARPAIDHLEGKKLQAYTISEAEWQAIEKNLAYADKLMPGNPRYLEALGFLQQLKLTLFGDELSTEDIEARADAAKYYFQKAVESRPTWPYYWGNLALEHYRRGNYAAEEYSLALANASRLGPWQNDTQQLVVDLGSETWEFLSPRAKRDVILSVERSLHRQPQNTVRVVPDGSWPGLCEASNKLVDISLPHLQTLCANERFSQ